MNNIVTSERLRRGYCISAAPAALDRTPSRHNRPCRSSHSLHSSSVNLLLAVIACAIFAGNGEARAASRGARLIVQRAPNFGNDRVVQLWIDRRKVAEIPRDQHYEGFVSDGHHTLSVLSLPNTESRQPTGMGLTVRSGRTYIFTAQWDSVRGTVLKRSTTASDTTAVKMPR